jgi:glycine/D-amino acid oxidase-like deaminating enzyme
LIGFGVLYPLPDGRLAMSVMSDKTGRIYDVVIVGGGVVGCAVLHELTNYGYKCLLVEKENALLSGASSGNRYVCRSLERFKADLSLN